MKILTETDTDVSAVQAERWTAEKIVRNMLSSWWGSAQRKLGLSVQFLFFAEIARRSLAKEEGGYIQIQETPLKEMSIKTRKALRSSINSFVF